MAQRFYLPGLAAGAALAMAGASPAAPPGDLCRPKVTAVDIVATAAQRLAAGAKVTPPAIIDPANGFAWPDTPLGAVKSLDGRHTLFFASDGGCHGDCASVRQRDGSITRTVGTLDNPLGDGAPVETLLAGAGLAPPVDYVGGGPVWRIPPGLEGAGDLILTYHAEEATYAPGHKFPDPAQYQVSFYSRLGLARSTDDGLTWTDLGFVVRANQPYEANAPGYEIGDGNLVPDPTGRWLYLYFPDRIVNGPSDTYLSVARAPLSAVTHAAAAGAGPIRFQKYYNGAWAQPGIGGLSSTVLPLPYPAHAGSPSVAYDTALGRLVAVLDDTQTISWSESADGVTWSNPVAIQGVDPNLASANYASLVGKDVDPATVGKAFYVYFTWSPNRTGWQGAQVRRLSVACSPQ